MNSWVERYGGLLTGLQVSIWACNRHLRISTSGLNYCLKALIDKGLVKVHNFSQSKNKFGYIYVLTPPPQGLAEKAQLTSPFLNRKLAEYDALQAEIAALQAEPASAPNPEALKCRSS